LKDYYKILGLPENATDVIIKQRFRELAFEYHPDFSDYRNAEDLFAGISGGSGPMGSIKSRTVSIPVPRSRKAQFIHRIGFLIKLSALIVAIIVVRSGLFPNAGITTKVLLFSALLLTGGLLTQLFYYLNDTKSKFLHASKFPLVKEYKKNGFKRGFHPMVSSTPVGLLVSALRLTF